MYFNNRDYIINNRDYLINNNDCIINNWDYTCAMIGKGIAICAQNLVTTNPVIQCEYYEANNNERVNRLSLA